MDQLKLEGALEVRLDGPYGKVTGDYGKSDPNLSSPFTESYPILFLVAGGIGITPIISILKHLTQPSKKVPYTHLEA